VTHPKDEPIYGNAHWASWWYTEEQWSVLAKVALFAVIITAVALWVRISKRRTTSDVGYEKTLA